MGGCVAREANAASLLPRGQAKTHLISLPVYPDVEVDEEVIGAVVRRTWLDEQTPASSVILTEALREPGVAYVVARSEGKAHGSCWASGESIAGALERAVRTLRVDVGKRGAIDTIEVVVGYHFEDVEPGASKRRLSNVHRGLRGLEIARGNRVERHAPTEMIATNRRFEKLVERFVQKHGPGPVKLRTFDAVQVLVPLSAGASPTRLLRGSTLVPVESITREAVQRLADLQASWLFNNLQPDGRMVYKYWPSAGKESSANNTIRQWMATVAMGRVARRRDDPSLIDRVEANIRYNLKTFYAERGDLGCIVEAGTKVKLGAVALACLALIEHPRREFFAREEKALRRTVDHLWQRDGSFVTFLEPAGRNDNQNFYPGEALLLWSILATERDDSALRERFMASFRYYRAWHLENRNPAFIPWHTQAYRRVWTSTGDVELADFIFTMNDWLLEIQQWDEQIRFPDTQGRFYDPKRPFGPPHASSTGVYLEGLIDAWRLAKSLGESERQERYRRAIIRGIRSVAQLTFKDPVDMFYINKRDKVRGGVRTTVYNNEIRVDNVQHNLMALLEIVGELPATDFRP